MIHKDYHKLDADKCYIMRSSAGAVHIVYNLGQIIDPKDCITQFWSNKNYYALKTMIIKKHEVDLNERLINAFYKTTWSKEEILLDEFNKLWAKEMI